MKFNTFTGVLVLGLVIGVAARSHGVIADFKQLSVDFTNPAEATNKATWSEPDKLSISKDGLGWDGEAAAYRDGWIQTKPLALGLSWRPPSAISVRVAIRPPPREFTLNNGQKSTPYGGDVYIRYSPDLAHWSSWQVLQQAGPQTPDEKKNPGRHWTGTIRVPDRDRDEYGRRLSDYSRLDVPWKSDEEAAVQWILGKDPDFFARHVPFIGYVEFLFEGGFHGGQRIRSFNAEISYAISGLHSLPKDPTADRDSSPWRFKARTESKTEAARESRPGTLR